MLNELYIIFTVALATALFVSGVLFYSISCNTENYVFKTVLRLITFTYCFFGLVNALELWSCVFMPDSNDALLFQETTLIVAVSQAFLFTFSLIFLIHAAYITRKRVLREIIPIITLSIAFIAARFILPANLVKITIWLFILFYIWLLIKYTRLFVIIYRDCLQKMDNFFSGAEAEHLKWVNISFYAALSIGVLALVSSLFPHVIIGVLCSIIYLIFYLYFACRIVNYGNIYKKLEDALSDEPIPLEQPEEGKNALQASVVNTIETNLNKWLAEKQFLQAGVTIDDLAILCHTNRSYLSEYINSEKEKTFRHWINELRIDYAKHLLAQNPKLELWQIAEQTGYTDSKYFSTQFKKITGKTPSEYRSLIG